MVASQPRTWRTFSKSTCPTTSGLDRGSRSLRPVLSRWEFEEALHPAAAREIVNLCPFLLRENPVRLGQLENSFGRRTLATATNAALGARLTQNRADQPIAAPLLIAQGLQDEVVLPAVTDAYVDERCAAGQRLEYWKMLGATTVASSSPARRSMSHSWLGPKRGVCQ